MLKILPPIWFVILLGAAVAAHYLMPQLQLFELSFPLQIIVASVVFIVGFVLPIWASNLFAKAQTEILPTSPQNKALVVTGPYRWSRNPMYLGIFLQLLGIALWMGTAPFFAAALAHIAIMRFVFIPFEEEKMRRQFGDVYDAYCAGVRRFL